MKCEKCNHELTEEAKFCLNCGAPVTKDETAAALASENSVVQTENGGNTNQATNEFVEKSVDLAKNYWEFLVGNIITPSKRSMNNTEKDFIFGYINVGLFALLIGLGTYFQLRAMLSFGGLFSIPVSFLETFPIMFIFTAALVMLGVGLIFVVLLFLMKVKVSFHDIVGRFGSLMTIPLALSILYFLFAIPGVHALSNFVLLVAFLGIQLAIVFTLLSHKEDATSSFDPIFALFSIFAIYTIFIGVTYELVLSSIISGISPF
ncbi:zinc ribbon domain-containing protein [Evansella cellulosilytica]|uniref:Zinc-ribbon domain-containing protein n=1 Tax=Evansella cellulosilytica (strain ATCC 21833 / DSM 2522 / FERM P-1141 / JCM 9156 / N-4) TaxID=649639 RepID=E6TQN4_EVAC2|nr:zinc ribbon domain-containing protein [Evansella cellulosilytica]ADU30545.1 hypothetical protein Bcell_2285 [Evansella cellulosilytica DSM 2522]